MTQKHPITPPPDLIEDWIELAKPLPQRPPDPNELATLAARWGADQELEFCVSYVDNNVSGNKARALRALRRPKLPSLKAQAIFNAYCTLADLRNRSVSESEMLAAALRETINQCQDGQGMISAPELLRIAAQLDVAEDDIDLF